VNAAPSSPHVLNDIRNLSASASSSSVMSGQVAKRTLNPTLETLSLLVVDDNEVNRLVVHRLLAKIGVKTVHLAADGKEAHTFCASGGNFVDCILMDLNMPVMDGVMASEQIRMLPNLSDIPIFAFTAVCSLSTCRGSNVFDGFVAKPCNLQSLQRLLDGLLKFYSGSCSIQDLRSLMNMPAGQKLASGASLFT